MPPALTLVTKCPASLTKQVPRQLHHDVVGLQPGLIGVTCQALLAGRATGQHFTSLRVVSAPLNAGCRVQLLGLAETQLVGDVRARGAERAGLAAAAVGQREAAPSSRRRPLAGRGFHRCVTGSWCFSSAWPGVIQVLHPSPSGRGPG